MVEKERRGFGEAAALFSIEQTIPSRSERVDEGGRSRSDPTDPSPEPGEQSLFAQASQDAAADARSGKLGGVIGEVQLLDLPGGQEAVLLHGAHDGEIALRQTLLELPERPPAEVGAHRMNLRERRQSLPISSSNLPVCRLNCDGFVHASGIASGIALMAAPFGAARLDRRPPARPQGTS